MLNRNKENWINAHDILEKVSRKEEGNLTLEELRKLESKELINEPTESEIADFMESLGYPRSAVLSLKDALKFLLPLPINEEEEI